MPLLIDNPPLPCIRTTLARVVDPLGVVKKSICELVSAAPQLLIELNVIFAGAEVVNAPLARPCMSRLNVAPVGVSNGEAAVPPESLLDQLVLGVV